VHRGELLLREGLLVNIGGVVKREGDENQVGEAKADDARSTCMWYPPRSDTPEFGRTPGPGSQIQTAFPSASGTLPY